MISACLLIVTLSPFSARSSTTVAWRERLEEAKSLFAKGQAAEGRAMLREAQGELLREIRRTPSDYFLYASLADIHRRLGEPDLAAAIRTIAEEACPKCADLYIQLGYFEINAGEAREAFKFFERARSIAPTDPVVYRHLGTYFQLQNRPAEAEALLQKALALSYPSNPGEVFYTTNHLASLYVEQGRFTKAEELYRKSIVLLAEAPGIDNERKVFETLRLARVCVIQKKDSEAEALYQKAGPEAASPLSRALVLGAKAFFLSRRDGSAEAEAIYRQAAVLLKDLPVNNFTRSTLHDMADFFATAGKNGDAEPIFVRLIREERRNPLEVPTVALVGLGRLRAKARRYHDAELLCVRALVVARGGRDYEAAGRALDCLGQSGTTKISVGELRRSLNEARRLGEPIPLPEDIEPGGWPEDLRE